jgi:predicted transcriptional regulator
MAQKNKKVVNISEGKKMNTNKLETEVIEEESIMEILMDMKKMIACITSDLLEVKEGLEYICGEMEEVKETINGEVRI